MNPADYASRGLSGPNSKQASISNWIKMVKVVAWVIKFKMILLTRIRKTSNSAREELQQRRWTVFLLDEARKQIVRWHQQNTFSEEIGGIFSKALEPKEVIPSKNDGLYAFRTLLAWCIVGPVGASRNNISLVCNRIVVQDPITKLSLGIPEIAKEDLKSLLLIEYSRQQIRNTGVSNQKQLRKKSGIYNLDPYLHEEGFVRVVGRLKKSYLNFSNIHSLLITKIAK